jgi:transposase-like protein
VATHPQIHHTDQRGIRTYQCQHCTKTFSELYGTIFYRSKIPLSDWMLAIVYWITATGSLSAADLGRKLGISHLSAWRMLMKIRQCIGRGLSDDILEGIVEADEAWFSRKDNQEIVMGIVERGRKKLRLMIIPDVKEKTLYPHVRDNVKKGSKFFTDSRITYTITGIEYHHQTTNHSRSEFARGEVHSNTIEQIWGDIKGIIRTLHHGIRKKYRSLYLAQYIFRYENKDSSNLFYKTLCQLFTPTYCLI